MFPTGYTPYNYRLLCPITKSLILVAYPGIPGTYPGKIIQGIHAVITGYVPCKYRADPL